MQIHPHPSLAHLVKHYLLLTGPPLVDRMHRVFADGNTGLVFNLGEALIGGQLNPCDTWLYGQVNTFYDLRLTGKINWIVVVFQPYGANHFWRVPATEWHDYFFPAENFFGNRLQPLVQQLQHASSIDARIALLNNFLLNELRHQTTNDALVVGAVKLITDASGIVTIKGLLQELSVTERTLERRFKTSVGIGPKRFADVVRMTIAAKQVQACRKEGFAGLAYDGGYYDQAHYIKSFKKYTGITPQQYQSITNPLALNFLQL
ncbi:helix-turn-helix transcriptional regulator [Chitinophaga horti]|uniref:Helix-turn-helix transcriptional regulator n=1 Tax=Chitinophaga horti TaxID=2920382 RepID=A0ABY6IWS6_9BACT|nr:helix-turn-helix domain-containing protein [Chitinophaga horti]UYQ91693.1 helix-turn-helix transcriptional regulator [Chitinophaga horti]